MKSNNIYAHLIENFNNPAFKVDVSEDSSFAVHAVDAIFQRRFHRNKQPYQALIENYAYDSLTNVEKSLLLEVKINELLTGMWEEKDLDIMKRSWEEISTLSEEALFLNPHAAISRVMLAREDIVINKEYEKGIAIMLDVLQEYPGVKWGYLYLVRLLIGDKQYKLVRPYIGKITPPIWRLIYFLTVRFFIPFSPIIIIGYFLWILLLARPYWIMIAILMPYGAIGVYTWVKKETPLKYIYFLWFAVILFFTIIGLVYM